MSIVDTSQKQRGRGVLEGAFQVLDALSRFPDGAGLSQLSRACELPKATTFRLLEQLVELGAVQRHGTEYSVGHLMARLGENWQPHPRLRRASRGPIRTLARLSTAAIAVTILDGDRVRVVGATRGTPGELPHVMADSASVSRTAAGQVLLASQPRRERPEAYTATEWRRLRSRLRQDDAVVVEYEDVLPGVCCVAAPAPLPDGQGVASVSALIIGSTVPSALPGLVLRAAGEISRGLAVH
ncbi:IclR family transcriptional regulator [Amycolatopsis taiwanensis]|uniref:IclR family transcriptional regulator n=1 Tax=Amycolatopsis taiwanensis TaxID=342230 RepID=A0A9W6R658_9PSEU|nr:helix-turn-helix domain-containing protein [Amycolatopsis taiwanensis]GLY69060.1 IclR family transcriptional regulator [Amycolatopsis taiwanensis]